MLAGYYNAREVGEKLGINQSSVKRVMQQNGIEGRPFGASQLYPQEAVEELAKTYVASKTPIRNRKTADVPAKNGRVLGLRMKQLCQERGWKRPGEWGEK